MPDMIPATKIAALALRHIEKATSLAPNVRYNAPDPEKLAASLTVASELLGLIAEPEIADPETPADLPDLGFLRGLPVQPPQALVITTSVDEGTRVTPPAFAASDLAGAL